MNALTRLLARLHTGSASDAPGIAETIHRALSAAGLERTGPQGGVREAIDRALADAGLWGDVPGAGPAPVGRDAPAVPREGPSTAGRGRVLRGSYADAHGRREYRLYLPVGYRPDGPSRPLLLMLHGCTQTAEDFAVGTRMDALADEHGFLVVYPQQTGRANQARCWNWFRPEDQRGDAGEPALLAGLVRQVAHDHRVDPRRVFAAGLSAGAAMAVILGRTRPDAIRAIGVHSGLPYASAHDVPSAFARMQGRADRRVGHAPDAASTVPTIVFHGDADRTVAPSNADALAADAVPANLALRREAGRTPGGTAYTRDIATDAAGTRRFERWTVHGAGHAWSGGDPAGSYTEPAGPDASKAMVAFFLQLR